jgi:glutaredoxin
VSLLDRLRGRRPEPVPVTLYSKPGCHLCEVMKQELARAGMQKRYVLEEVDIGTDPKLSKLYGTRIPVLAIAGRVAFEGKLDPAQFERVLGERAAEWDRARALARALDGEGRPS